MPASEEVVANEALYLIGEKGTLTDIDGTDALSVLVNTFFDETRDEVCKMIPWNCLKTTTTLSLTSATAESSYTSKHTLATTVLTVLNINGDKKKPFERRGVTLYTNEASGYFLHTAKATDPTTWSQLLSEAIVTLLAHKMCMRRTGDPQLALMLYQEFLNRMIAGANAELLEGNAAEYAEMFTVVQQLVPPVLRPPEGSG